MRVRMKTAIGGYRDGEPWPPVGGVIDLPDHEAADLVTAGHATEATGAATREDTAGDGDKEAAEGSDEKAAGDGDKEAGTVRGAEAVKPVGRRRGSK